MAIREPNSEQKKAIEHKGGVLLSAGAGSGKTFVLVEHVIYLVSDFIKLDTSTDLVEFESSLKSYLSKIVLMTFTKDAAGELQLRLEKRFSQVEPEENEKTKWEKAKSCLDYMTVGTIHGFCFKLLSQGFFYNFDPNVAMLSDAEFNKKIDTLVESWIKGTDKEKRSFYNILENKENVVEAMSKIFSSPELRMQWENAKERDLISYGLPEFFSEYIELMNWSILWEETYSASDFEGKPGKWHALIEESSSLFQSTSLSSLPDLEKVIEFFKNISRMPALPKSVDNLNAIKYFEKLKELRALITESSEDLIAFEEEKNDGFLNWAKTFLDIFNYIHKNYEKIPGITFSDLEYFVVNGLKDDEILRNIQSSYNYFIIDEFQDTSYIQYDIIKNLTSNNFSKVFCVGDIKQAIYGFRSGEIGVFLDCQKNVPLGLSLKNNYRSSSNVINFNNFLFENIFPKGVGFDGLEKNPVPVEYQDVPDIQLNEGSLSKFNVQLEGDKKPSQSQLDLVECSEIVNLLSEKPEWVDEGVCILFRKLTPLKYLIPLLIKKDISFSSQFKVKFEEDPLIALFKTCLEVLIEKEKDNKNFELLVGYAVFFGGELFRYLNLEVPDFDERKIRQFVKNSDLYGVKDAFQKLLFDCNIYNSNVKNNIAYIEDLVKISGEDCHELWSLLDKQKGDDYSIDFQYGNNPEKIKIMTVHRSKGLEFAHVILGGIHTNGGSRGSVNYIGKMVGSFKWKGKKFRKKPYKSPLLFIEDVITKKKEFSESKRLFYVACTRAKDNIIWFDLSFKGSTLSYGDSSWIDGIRKWEYELDEKYFKIKEVIKQKSLLLEKSVNQYLDSGFGGQVLPLFQRNNMGIVDNSSTETNLLGVVSELSVTKLATLAECPRKFYLANICKFDSEDLEKFESSNQVEIFDENKNQELERDEGEFIQVIKSSATRGTFLHENISKMLLNNLTIPLEVTEKKDQKILNWVKSLILSEHNGWELISEVLLKFPVFNFMISGTPDLILKNENQVEIWDFKTGMPKPSKEVPYWYQLYLYAFSQFEAPENLEISRIKISLVYLDKEEFSSKIITKTECREFIWNNWKKLGHLDQINNEHCEHCSFGNLCH